MGEYMGSDELFSDESGGTDSVERYREWGDRCERSTGSAER